MHLNHLLVNVALGVTGFLLAILVAGLLMPRLFPGLQGKLTARLQGMYQKKFFAQLRDRFPELAEKFGDFAITEPRMERFNAGLKRLPPQEGVKIQAEFLRLRDGFLARHPDVAPLITQLMQGTDAKAQGQAMTQLMKLPEAQRKAISKDLIWAYDQFCGRFPKWSQALLAPLRKGPDELAAASGKKGKAAVAGKPAKKNA